MIAYMCVDGQVQPEHDPMSELSHQIPDHECNSRNPNSIRKEQVVLSIDELCGFGSSPVPSKPSAARFGPRSSRNRPLWAIKGHDDYESMERTREAKATHRPVEFAKVSSDIQKVFRNDAKQPTAVWRSLVSILTFLIPDAALRAMGGHTSNQKRLWRDKFVTFVIFLVAQGIVVWSMYRMIYVNCTGVDAVVSHLDTKKLEKSVLVNGFVYCPPEDLGYSDLMGRIANSNFASNHRICPKTIPDNAYCFGQGKRKCRKLRPIKKYSLGRVSFPWSAVEASDSLLALHEMVLDTNIYLKRDKGFLGPDFNARIAKLIGKDATRMASRDPLFATQLDCFSRLYRVGFIQGITWSCIATYSFLTILITWVVLSNGVQFFYACRLTAKSTRSKDQKGQRWPRRKILVLIDCQADMDPVGLQRTLDSLTQDRESECDKIVFIIVRGQNAKLAEFLSSALRLGRDDASTEPCEQGRLHRGLYSHQIPTVWLETRECQFTDPQSFMIQVLNSLEYNEIPSPMAVVIQHSFLLLQDDGLEDCAYLLVTQGGTQIRPGAVDVLVLAMEDDPLAIAVKGLSQAGNKRDTIFTKIQYLQHQLTTRYAASFDAARRHSSYIDPNFTMYRLGFSNDKTIPTIMHPSLRECFVDNRTPLSLLQYYSECDGKDYFLVRAICKKVPMAHVLFVPQAKCLISLPDDAHKFIRYQTQEYLRTFYSTVRNICSTSLGGSRQFLLLFKLMEISTGPALSVSLVYMVIRTIAKKSIALPEILFIFLVMLLFTLPVLLTSILGRMRSNVYWTLFYFLALPFFGFTLPIYAFWSADKFVRMPERPAKTLEGQGE